MSMKKEIIHWDDINCTVVFNFNSDTAPNLDFSVYEITGRSEDKDTKQFTERIYARKYATSSEDETRDIELAETLLRGIIKWDACSHLNYGDENGYVHTCGYLSWKQMHEVIKRVWNYATEKGFTEEEFENKL